MKSQRFVRKRYPTSFLPQEIWLCIFEFFTDLKDAKCALIIPEILNLMKTPKFRPVETIKFGDFSYTRQKSTNLAHGKITIPLYDVFEDHELLSLSLYRLNCSIYNKVSSCLLKLDNIKQLNCDTLDVLQATVNRGKIKEFKLFSFCQPLSRETNLVDSNTEFFILSLRRKDDYLNVIPVLFSDQPHDRSLNKTFEKLRYVNGRLDGPYKRFNLYTFEIIEDGWFDNGFPRRRWTHYSPGSQGRIPNSLIIDNRGNDENGKLITDNRDRVVKIFKFYENGNLRESSFALSFSTDIPNLRGPMIKFFVGERILFSKNKKIQDILQFQDSSSLWKMLHPPRF